MKKPSSNGIIKWVALDRAGNVLDRSEQPVAAGGEARRRLNALKERYPVFVGEYIVNGFVAEVIGTPEMHSIRP